MQPHTNRAPDDWQSMAVLSSVADWEPDKTVDCLGEIPANPSWNPPRRSSVSGCASPISGSDDSQYVMEPADPITTGTLIRVDNFQVIIGTILLREQKAMGKLLWICDVITPILHLMPSCFLTFFSYFLARDDGANDSASYSVTVTGGFICLII